MSYSKQHVTGLYCAGCGIQFKFEARVTVLAPAVINLAGTVQLEDASADSYYCEDCRDNLTVKRPELNAMPVSMVRGELQIDCDSGMPCHMKVPNSTSCARSGEDCEIIYDTINRYGIIVGMRIINEAMDKWQDEYHLPTLIQNIAYDMT